MRRIDPKFHIEGEEIIKTSNGQAIPEDEPLFLVRGRDYLALPLLKHYRSLSLEDGCTEYHMELVDAAIKNFEIFQQEHTDRMKQPGITRGL